MRTIKLNIPADQYGDIATAAALRGVDISQWVKRRIIKAAISARPDIQDTETPAAGQDTENPAAGDTKTK